MNGGIFRCDSIISLSEDSEASFLGDSIRISLKEYISKGKYDDEYIFRVVADPICPPNLIHDEIRYFLQTIKQMYQL